MLSLDVSLALLRATVHLAQGVQDPTTCRARERLTSSGSHSCTDMPRTDKRKAAQQ